MSRVLLDTNVWVSAFLAPNGHCGRLVRRLARPPHAIVSSKGALSELADVLARPRLVSKYRYAPGEVREYMRPVWSLVSIVEPVERLFGCRDPEDDVICGAAVAGRVQYLVTRDDDVKRDWRLADALAREGVRVASVAQVNALLDTDEADPSSTARF